MITIKDAQALVSKVMKTNPKIWQKIENSAGFVTAEPILARENSPAFDKSAMDGFVISKCVSGFANLQVSGIIKAGSNPPLPPFSKGGLGGLQYCYKIMTGAPVPKWAIAVVPKEDTIEKDGYVTFKKSIKPGQFIRLKGGEFKKGSVILEKNSLLTPAAIGLLASQGITKVQVYKKPAVAILTTGNEIVRPNGKKIKGSQVYDANFHTISAALSGLGIEPKDLGICSDSPNKLKEKICRGLKSDMLLISGGVSVGDFDFVKDILKDVGVRKIFWQVAQKPGKPLFFGMARSGVPVFGLPGNPASVLVCIYEYVLPAIRKMMGHKNIWPITAMAKLAEAYANNGDRDEFVRGIYNDGYLQIIAETESHMLKGFAKSNALFLASARKKYGKDEIVPVKIFYSFGGAKDESKESAPS